MNERIAKLANQSGFDVDTTGKFGNYSEIHRLEKFAQLIVQECMRMCEVTEMSFVTHNCDVEASGAITVKQFIAEHFELEP